MALTIQKTPDTYVLTGNPVEFVISSNTVTQTNHKIHVEIAEQIDVGQGFIVYNLLAEDVLPVINNSVTFDLADYLKRKEIADFNIFDLFSKQIRSFKPINYVSIRFYETYNNDSIKHNITTYYTRFFIQGGFSSIFLKNFNAETRSFYQEYVTNNTRKFLSWAPDKKLTWNQHDFLFFIHNENEIYYKITLYFNDNTTQEVDSTSTVFGGGRHFCWLNSSYLANELYSYETSSKKIIRYTIQLFDGNNIASSEIKTFYIDNNYYNQGKQFIFKNSLAGYDIIYLKGLSENINEIQRTIGYFQTKNDISFTEFTETFEAASGFLVNSYKSVKDAQRYITELFNSREIYEIVGKEIIPVIPNDKKITIQQDNEFLYSFSFSYEYAYSDDFFAPLNTEQYLNPRIFYRNGTITPSPAEPAQLATLDFEAMLNEAITIDFEINWGADVGITYLNAEVMAKDVWKSLQTQIIIPGNVVGSRIAIVTDSKGGRYQITYEVGDINAQFNSAESALFNDGEQAQFNGI